MEFGRVCDIGKRDNNEDGILTLEMYADIGFFAVADILTASLRQSAFWIKRSEI